MWTPLIFFLSNGPVKSSSFWKSSRWISHVEGKNIDDPLQIQADAAEQRTILVGRAENSANSNTFPTALRHDLQRVTKQP